jgi:RNA polymerase sigma-70 factor (ECF subfamily)
MVEAATRRAEDSAAVGIAEVFNLHGEFVWRSLRRLGVAEADADDALQEVFLVVHRRLSDYQDRGLMRAWLFSISRQIAGHYHRGLRRSEARHRGLVLSTTAPDADEIVARREAEKLVGAFLDELDEPQRMVFYLSDIEGLTAPEIASALETNLNTVYGRLRAARKRFEALIAERARREGATP